MALQTPAVPDPLGSELVLDELFDLTLYQALHRGAQGELREILGALIPVETRHFAFWQKFFGLPGLDRLDFGRRVRLIVMLGACRLFGPVCVQLVLEAIEVYGVRKYLAVWQTYKDQPLGAAVREILTDEFEHEDSLVSGCRERRIDPERISAIFLGFNDGPVEILGAVSGFFAAFHDSSMVLMAGFSVAAAGAFSMGAGAFVAAGSANEMRLAEAARKRFLGSSAAPAARDLPMRTALIVALSYLIGAMVPLLPVVCGATSVLSSVLTALAMVVLVSTLLAFLSGMDVKRRILTNVTMIFAAAAFAYVIGRIARDIWGIPV
ncbi:MAG: VIT1/CCC1 transporter family protein [Elusimicrobiota bacterium]